MKNIEIRDMNKKWRIFRLDKLNEQHKLNERSYGFKFSEHLDYIDDKIVQDLHWASKAIPHRSRDIKKANKLGRELYKVLKSLVRDAHDVS
jgi:hypothetical protein